MRYEPRFLGFPARNLFADYAVPAPQWSIMSSSSSSNNNNNNNRPLLILLLLVSILALLLRTIVPLLYKPAVQVAYCLITPNFSVDLLALVFFIWGRSFSKFHPGDRLSCPRLSWFFSSLQENAGEKASHYTKITLSTFFVAYFFVYWLFCNLRNLKHPDIKWKLNVIIPVHGFLPSEVPHFMASNLKYPLQSLESEET